MKFKKKTNKKLGGSASSNPTTMKHRNKITTSKSAIKVSCSGGCHQSLFYHVRFKLP